MPASRAPWPTKAPPATARPISAHVTESIALLALRDPEGKEEAPTFGLLVMGSADARRFHDGMATDFLTQIGALASAALSRLLPR